MILMSTYNIINCEISQFLTILQIFYDIIVYFEMYFIIIKHVIKVMSLCKQTEHPNVI